MILTSTTTQTQLKATLQEFLKEHGVLLNTVSKDKFLEKIQWLIKDLNEDKPLTKINKAVILEIFIYTEKENLSHPLFLAFQEKLNISARIISALHNKHKGFYEEIFDHANLIFSLVNEENYIKIAKEDGKIISLKNSFIKLKNFLVPPNKKKMTEDIFNKINDTEEKINDYVKHLGEYINSFIVLQNFNNAHNNPNIKIGDKDTWGKALQNTLNDNNKNPIITLLNSKFKGISIEKPDFDNQEIREALLSLYNLYAHTEWEYYQEFKQQNLVDKLDDLIDKHFDKNKEKIVNAIKKIYSYKLKKQYGDIHPSTLNVIETFLEKSSSDYKEHKFQLDYLAIDLISFNKFIEPIIKSSQNIKKNNTPQRYENIMQLAEQEAFNLHPLKPKHISIAYLKDVARFYSLLAANKGKNEWIKSASLYWYDPGYYKNIREEPLRTTTYYFANMKGALTIETGSKGLSCIGSVKFLTNNEITLDQLCKDKNWTKEAIEKLSRINNLSDIVMLKKLSEEYLEEPVPMDILVGGILYLIPNHASTPEEYKKEEHQKLISDAFNWLEEHNKQELAYKTILEKINQNNAYESYFILFELAKSIKHNISLKEIILKKINSEILYTYTISHDQRELSLMVKNELQNFSKTIEHANSNKITSNHTKKSSINHFIENIFTIDVENSLDLEQQKNLIEMFFQLEQENSLEEAFDHILKMLEHTPQESNTFQCSQILMALVKYIQEGNDIELQKTIYKKIKNDTFPVDLKLKNYSIIIDIQKNIYKDIQIKTSLDASAPPEELIQSANEDNNIVYESHSLTLYQDIQIENAEPLTVLNTNNDIKYTEESSKTDEQSKKPNFFDQNSSLFFGKLNDDSHILEETSLTSSKQSFKTKENSILSEKEKIDFTDEASIKKITDLYIPNQPIEESENNDTTKNDEGDSAKVLLGS